MTPRALLAAMLALLVTGCQHVTVAEAAVLNVSFRLPTTDNAGSCDSVVSVPRTLTPMWGHVQWFSTVRGGVSGRDSLSGLPGDTVRFAPTVPPGEYRVTAWASDEGGHGCKAEIVLTVRSVPGRVSFVP